MENTLTKKQALALYDVCTHWRTEMQDIIDVDSYKWFYEWKDFLTGISFTYTLPVNMGELYDAIDELSIALLDKIRKGEFK